jgi:hypothetical protein
MMVVLEGTIIGVRRLRAGTRIPHLLFNVAVPSLALWADDASYAAFGIPPLVDLQPDQTVPIGRLILSLIVFTVVDAFVVLLPELQRGAMLSAPEEAAESKTLSLERSLATPMEMRA